MLGNSESRFVAQTGSPSKKGIWLVGQGHPSEKYESSGMARDSLHIHGKMPKFMATIHHQGKIGIAKNRSEEFPPFTTSGSAKNGRPHFDAESPGSSSCGELRLSSRGRPAFSMACSRGFQAKPTGCYSYVSMFIVLWDKKYGVIYIYIYMVFCKGTSSNMSRSGIT